MTAGPRPPPSDSETASDTIETEAPAEPEAADENAEVETAPPEPKPYEWEPDVVPAESIRLWTEVGAGLDRSQTVVWKSAVESLNKASRYLSQSPEARTFVESYMMAIIGILVEQQPAKIGAHERQCVQESLSLATAIVARDISIQLARGAPTNLLNVLACLFNKKKTYYKVTKGNWNANHLNGLPEVRMLMMTKFKKLGGFAALSEYLMAKIGTPDFPNLEVLHQILSGLADALLSSARAVPPAPPVQANPQNGPTAVPVNPQAPGGPAQNNDPNAMKEWEDLAIRVGEAVMRYIHACPEDTLKKLATEHLSTVQLDLKRIFDRLITTRRQATYQFYEFWRAFVHKLITSQSLPLKLFGWTEIDGLLEASAEHRPPPRSYMAHTAGCTFVNGPYVFSGSVTADGYAQRGMDISYERNIPADEPDGGKKLTLFRCTMRSQQKWWFLSEADEEQPGTDRDIDYYQHKSKQEEETQPPMNGWVTCRNAGIDPPPILQHQGLMVPPGQEFLTLEHQLARWAIENGIIELVLGDSVHREIVARSTALIKFLAGMCDRDSHIDPGPDTLIKPNQFCLQTSHLLLAWKTCTKKADAAVSTQVYQLLVTILPSCPTTLAIPLLQAIKASLNDTQRDYLNEVAEFCAALAVSAGEAMTNKAKSSPAYFQPETRAEVLELFWSVFVHPEASSLKTYDSLKRFVTAELGVEPAGRAHRERYLQFCVNALEQSITSPAIVNEMQTFRMVKLTHFVLEACPRDHAAQLVEASNGALATLLFRELVALLVRRKSGGGGVANGVNLRKSPSSDDVLDRMPLSERLRILRHVHGLSKDIYMKSPQLNELWMHCDSPQDHEEIMVFVASASSSSQITAPVAPSAVPPPPAQPAASIATTTLDAAGPQPNSALNVIHAAFTNEVCREAFYNLFCSPSVSFETLGVKAYSSFQSMFRKIQAESASVGYMIDTHTTEIALDALWRICLRAGSDEVAGQAMNDLLAVYAGRQSPAATNGWAGKVAGPAAVVRDAMQTDSTAATEEDESFPKRVFDCLNNVKDGLRSGEASAELAAERCLRILNAAIGQSGSGNSSITLSTVRRLRNLAPTAPLREATICIPHGMRGQANYRKVSIMAKCTAQPYGPQPQQATISFDSPNHQRNTTLRFHLDVHPLETMASIKRKVAIHCKCNVTAVKPMSSTGRATGNGDSSQQSLGVVPEDSVADEIGIIEGCELIFLIAERQSQQTPANVPPTPAKIIPYHELSELFVNQDGNFSDSLFGMVLEVLSALPWRDPDAMTDSSRPNVDVHALVWDLLLAMPTNSVVGSRVRVTASGGDISTVEADAMEIDSKQDQWSKLLDLDNLHRSVYTLLAIDAFLQPAPEVLACLPPGQCQILEREMNDEAGVFRRGFIDSGGFDAVVRFFSGAEGGHQSKTRMGNAVALRILKCCLFGDQNQQQLGTGNNGLDEAGTRLLKSLSNAGGLLKSLASMVVGDSGISTSTVSDVLKFLRLLFRSPVTAKTFASLPNGMAEKLLITLLLWEGHEESSRPAAAISSAQKVRKSTHDMILLTPFLSDNALTWLIHALNSIRVDADSTVEYFDVLKQLVGDERSSTRSRSASPNELTALSTVVCQKLTSCQRPTKESTTIDHATGVLSGCLALVRALIESGGGVILRDGTAILVNDLKLSRWSQIMSPTSGRAASDDAVLIDLMGVMFDAFLSPGGSTSVVAVCCDKESRQHGFDVVGAAARSCSGSDGYSALVSRINSLIKSAAPYLRHRWGQFGGNENITRGGRNTSKYSGLRNQGCTCYMNSVLQQLFMMPELRTSMCAAPLPSTVRSAGGVVSSKGAALVGKKLSMQWDNGVSYDAIVEAFDKESGMHTIRYCPTQVATVGGTAHPQVQPEDIARLPPVLPDELFLSEGRPGKETGVFSVVKTAVDTSPGAEQPNTGSRPGQIEESEDEVNSRHLLEEVQRTFIHLDEGSRGRCFDPRALVEACTCLKLEFDVWQQNDASEFTTKLLDRLEISLKRWAPEHFRYMDHTFGLKQTKQKICKECGLKTNRQEKLLSVDCQIRGKADIHEALASMTEVEIMDGNNQVFCDRCKKNTDTVLKTAIASLPNMMILSLKRFDLDYNTFETVKLNSRCAFGQTLNMKRYTLEGLEALEKAEKDSETEPMDTGNGDSMDEDAMRHLPDEDYEYHLAGVLVHAGVAQGGHYYSFIKDRNKESQGKWFRFDDEDVTPFDSASIETECFGGKVKKETKWPNGQVHTVESEQYANALMLFYEKVKKTEVPSESETKDEEEEKTEGKKEEVKEQPEKKKPPPIPKDLPMSSGFDVFEPDVMSSNTTHRWQTLLFDNEFQTFLKGLLGLCRMTSNDSEQMDGASLESSQTRSIETQSWRSSVVQMLLSFMFDVLLYASDRSSLHEWVQMLNETLNGDRSCAIDLVTRLAQRTRGVSSNWLRTYLLDCPDGGAREAAVDIFSWAILSTLRDPTEQKALEAWSGAWAEQVSDRGSSSAEMPCQLEGRWQIFEDVTTIGHSTSSTSSTGIILSYLNVLLESLPRCWRQSPDIFKIIRNLVYNDADQGGELMKQAMIAAMIPARLICIVAKERAPPELLAAFPGASVAGEVAESQMRTEQNPTPHFIPLSGSVQILNTPEMNYRGGSASDHHYLFEALCCMMGLPEAVQAPVLEDPPKGRQRYVLTEQVKNALAEVYAECCAPGATGMGQREIEEYLRRCGIDSAAIPIQKIIEIMAKYPTAGVDSEKGANTLSQEGFFAYYKDAATVGEDRIRLDLHLLGFRPDFTRRERDARIVVVNNREQIRITSESVARDVALLLKDKVPSLGHLADIGMSSFQLFAAAAASCEPIGEMLVSAAGHKRNCDHLITETLRAVFNASPGWPGSEVLSPAMMVLRVLVSLPDSKQRERIDMIMNCAEQGTSNVDGGVGLMLAARFFYEARPGQHYSNEVHSAYDRYVQILKSFLNLGSTFVWLNENRDQWEWMERDLVDPYQQSQSPTHARGEYSHRDGEGKMTVTPRHHHASDSDMPGINDSEEEDDEDSRYEDPDDAYRDAPAKIAIRGAGVDSVNGNYARDGFFERIVKYSLPGEHGGTPCVYSLFQCNVSNNTKHWYISVVPHGGQPGTSNDIDFYSTPVTNECTDYPPHGGWTKANEGIDPPPKLHFRDPGAQDLP